MQNVNPPQSRIWIEFCLSRIYLHSVLSSCLGNVKQARLRFIFSSSAHLHNCKEPTDCFAIPHFVSCVICYGLLVMVMVMLYLPSSSLLTVSISARGPLCPVYCHRDQKVCITVMVNLSCVMCPVSSINENITLRFMSSSSAHLRTGRGPRGHPGGPPPCKLPGSRPTPPSSPAYRSCSHFALRLGHQEIPCDLSKPTF